MEKELKITQFQRDVDSDVDELSILINTDEPRPAQNVLADAEHGIYLRLDLESDQIIGALIFHANEWFDEIARAFQSQDLKNPDVRFFLEKKLNELAQQNSLAERIAAR